MQQIKNRISHEKTAHLAMRGSKQSFS